MRGNTVPWLGQIDPPTRKFVLVWFMASSILASSNSINATSEPGLTNQDVLALVQARMSDDIIVAKIRQATKVNFMLDVEDIVTLRDQGVGDAVLEAMLERDGEPDTTPGIFDATGGTEASAVAWQEDLGLETIRVALEQEDGPVRLRGMKGEMSSSGVLGFKLMFMDYPGLEAKTRTSSRRPKLLIQSSTPLTGGKYFLANLNSDTDDGIRSLKISSAKQRLKTMFGGSSRRVSEPDKDWVVDFTAEEIEQDVWQVMPSEDLKPGEYGWYVDSGQRQSAMLFDFGVD